MGHTRLGRLARTRRWLQVIGLLQAGATAAQIARATMIAAEQGFKAAANDPGLQQAFWLLTQLPLAARSPHFVERLREAGLQVSDKPSLMELMSSFSQAVETRTTRSGGRSDVGEMAEASAVEVLSRFMKPRTQNLFGTTSQDLQSALAGVGTHRQFSNLSQDFFANFTRRCLDYFVSREVANHVGPGERFPTLQGKRGFDEALQLHSVQASKIVEEFSGGWFSKTNWEKEGISRDAARDFLHVAMKKLVSELKQGASPDEA